MKLSQTYLASASALVLATLISLGSSQAETKMKPGVQQPTADQENCDMDGSCPPDADKTQQNRVDDENTAKKPRKKEGQTTQDQNDKQSKDAKSSRQASKSWQYDANKHQRRRNKDTHYKYFYGGYWYEEPYWTGEVYGNPERISCGEGREIIDNRGYSRVRVIECSGRTFTYAARRHGDMFRVVLNSRSGNIMSVRPL